MPANALGEGIELPIRASHASGANAEERPQRFARRRTTLVDLGKKLEACSEPDAATATATKILAVYTLARVAGNVLAVGWEASYFAMFDGVLRPVMTGFAVHFLLRNNGRFSEKSLLHLWCRRAIFSLAFFVGDDGFLGLVVWAFQGSAFAMNSLCVLGTLLWEIGCNCMQMHMTNLKLSALDRGFTAKLCHVVGILGILSILFLSGKATIRNCLYGHAMLSVTDLAVVNLSLFCCCVILLTQCCSLCFVACRALLAAGGDKAIRSTAHLLLGSAVLVLLGPALSFWSFYTYLTRDILLSKWKVTSGSWLTFDLFLQICNTLALSGVVGPKQWNRPMDAFRQLADLSGFGFASKRIAFPGHINERATKCIVSFPGKYSELWDEAVSAVTSQAGKTGTDSWSLACVFLTDAASGLGQHAENLDTPGKCWCHSI